MTTDRHGLPILDPTNPVYDGFPNWMFELPDPDGPRGIWLGPTPAEHDAAEAEGDSYEH